MNVPKDKDRVLKEIQELEDEIEEIKEDPSTLCQV